MPRIRPVAEIVAAHRVTEGAGVKLRRAFGSSEVPRFDPFLMLDDFRSDNAADFLAGFPWHPHRGIETVTYLLAGSVEHQDSLGNKGVLGPGDVQWMTAGSGVIHQEMPEADEHGRNGGFQLWVNLPASHKMTDARYCGVDSADIPVVSGDGATVRVICGSAAGATGPVTDIVSEPSYLDVELAPGASWEHGIPAGHTVVAYVFEGSVRFGGGSESVSEAHTVRLGDGDVVTAEATAEGGRFLLLSGIPLGEPVAWGGPIVMNSEREVMEAFEEYRSGTFVKHAPR
jgi:quercetin 2,3-dioxygenase